MATTRAMKIVGGRRPDVASVRARSFATTTRARRGRGRARVDARASFFNRDDRPRDDDDEDDDGVYYGKDDEAYDGEEYDDEDDSKGAGMSLDDAVASFNETAGGFMDKIKSVAASQTVDLDVVEIVEEDVYERPKRRGFEMPTFGSFGGSRSMDEEEEEEEEEEAPRRRFGFGGGWNAR